VGFTQKVYEWEIRWRKTPEGKFVSLYEVDYEDVKDKLDILSFDFASELWFDWKARSMPRSLLRKIYLIRKCCNSISGSE
jgi:hypothetical protein